MGIFNSSSIYLVAGAVIGLGSAVAALDRFGLNAVPNNPGWQEWRASGEDRLQPYALGHFLIAGQVPTPSSAHYYVRTVDDAGNSLRGDCVFKVEGPITPARWWSLSAGHADSDAPDESVLSAGRAILEADGHLVATLAREPMPGNWLRPASSGTYSLIFVVSEPTPGAAPILPHVTKGEC
jgi:hypothetical protein